MYQTYYPQHADACDTDELHIRGAVTSRLQYRAVLSNYQCNLNYKTENEINLLNFLMSFS